ncbi:hypothetical protein [Spiroplasma endosymbiont of Dactylopius coccus]
MENNNKPQTKFPQKQTKLNQAEVENDYLIDNIPYDFTNLMSSKGETLSLKEHMMNLN